MAPPTRRRPDVRCLALALTVLGLLLPIGLAASANAAPLVPDSSFSGDGRATIAVADYNLAALAVAIAPDGKIVVAGEGTSRTGSRLGDRCRTLPARRHAGP